MNAVLREITPITEKDCLYIVEGGMPLAAFREGFCGEFEQRRAADRHRCPGAFREGADSVVLIGPEMPVDAVERAGLQFVPLIL